MQIVNGIVLAAAGLSLWLGGVGAALAETLVTVAVLDTLTEDEPLARAKTQLAKILPAGMTGNVVAILAADAVTGITRLQPDFVVGPADLDLQFRAAGEPVPFRVATRKTRWARDAARSTGSLFVARRDRGDINSLEDLRGRRVGATLPTSLPGWLAAQAQIRRVTGEREGFWGETFFVNFPYPDLVSALLSGTIDAAVFPACLLERLERDGEADVGRLKPVAEKADDGLACRHSTELYPDISLWGFNWTHENLVRAMTVGLLTMPPDDERYEWLSVVPHAAVEALYRDLEIGPYAYLRDNSVKGLYRRYKNWIDAALLFVAILVAYEARLQFLVRRRTRQLTEALARQRETEAEARRDRQRLGTLEKRNIVSQMSAMIAHEVKSPVAAICNFKAILDYVLAPSVREDKTVATALSGIETEAERIAGIVTRVRNYAKSRQTAHVACDFADIVRRATKSLGNSLAVSVPVRLSLPASAPIEGDALELELLVFNLMKNAVEALAGKKTGEIVVTLANAEGGGRWLLEVRDNGARLSDEEFARLRSLMDSVKPEGLGLGLSIVRGIADSHGGRLNFERNPGGGLTVRFSMDAAAARIPDGDQDHRESERQGES